MSDKIKKTEESEVQAGCLEQLQTELELLHKVNQALVSATGLDDTLQKVVEEIGASRYAAADIQLLAEDKHNLVVSAFYLDSHIQQQIERVTGQQIKGLNVPLFRKSINWPVIFEGKPLITDDVERIFADFYDDEAPRKLAPMVAGISRFKGVLRVPLYSSNGTIGLLGVASNVLLDESDLRIVMRIAGQVGLAVDKARLEQQLREYSERLEAMVKERTKELEAINQITATVSRTLNLDTILKNALIKVLEVLDLGVGAVFVTEKGEATVKLMFHQGLPQDMATAMAIIKPGQGYPGLVVQRGEPIIENNLEEMEIEDALLRRHPELKAIVAVPLDSKGKVRGVLTVLSGTRNRFSNAEAKMLVTIGSEIGVALENAWLYEKSYMHSKKMEELSITDSLTGLFNRRHFYRRLKEELARASRQKHHLSLLVVDLDNFKSYNDRYGHIKGDEALRGVAQAISAGIRQDVDTGYRYGGDEFAVILPYSDWTEAQVVAERIRSTFEGFSLPGTSLSIGIAQHAGGEKLDVLVGRADTAMYLAKDFGGNRVYVEMI